MAPLTQFKYSQPPVAGAPAIGEWWQNVKELPQWVQQQEYTKLYGAPKGETQQLIEGLRDIQAVAEDPERIKQKLQILRESQAEQMKQAAPYKMMFELPGQLYQAFALPGQIRLAGATAANEMVARGLQAAAATQMPGLNYQRPNIQYF